MRLGGPAAVACVAVALLAADPAQAAELVVTSTADDGPGSLRAAVAAAEADGAADRIRVLAPGTVELESPLEPIDTALSIAGPVTVEAGDFRVLTVSAGADVLLDGVTLRGGSVSAGMDAAEGGGVWNAGALVLRSAVVTGNEARAGVGRALGGGVFNVGTLTLQGATVSGNAVAADGGAQGGGIFNRGAVVVEDSTISGNTGEGLANAAGHAVARRSTFTGNGTGLRNESAELTLETSTVSGNGVGVGARFTGITTIHASTVADPLVAYESDVDTYLHVTGSILAGCAISVQTTITSGGGNVARETTCGFLGAGDQAGADPGLAPLAANGGPTLTRAIAPGSPAVDRGSATGPDQRGAPRSGAPDAGAYELQPAVVVPAPRRSAVVRCDGRRATIVGTHGRDSLRGTSRRDVIAALGGRDTIRSLGGNDLVCAGRGGDRVHGGRGRDRVLGGPGRDTCRGGPGRDRLRRCER